MSIGPVGPLISRRPRIVIPNEEAYEVYGVEGIKAIENITFLAFFYLHACI